MKISQKNKILTNFENCNDNLWTSCIVPYHEVCFRYSWPVITWRVRNIYQSRVIPIIKGLAQKCAPCEEDSHTLALFIEKILSQLHHRFQFIFQNSISPSTWHMSIATWLDPEYKMSYFKSEGNSTKFKLNYPVIHFCMIDNTLKEKGSLKNSSLTDFSLKDSSLKMKGSLKLSSLKDLNDLLNQKCLSSSNDK